MSIKHFNPRPPRGGRHCPHRGILMRFLFQSTPSARRATKNWQKYNLVLEISIHALREEGDRVSFCFFCNCFIFQSTPSARRATRWCHRCLPRLSDFNPRPPRGGRLPLPPPLPPLTNFNPRPPRGGRRVIRVICNVRVVISIHALREEGDD